MTCTRYPDDDVVVRYVTSDLAEPELSAFEDHMFGCDACLARVERYQVAQGLLAARELPAMPTAVPPNTPSRPAFRQMSWWVVGAVAAGLVVVLGGLMVMARRPAPVTAVAGPAQAPVPPSDPTAPPAPETIPAGARSGGALQVAVLAMVTPPPYLPLTTRGEATDTVFADGMNAYARGDWASASRALQQFASPQASFYRGIADLMRGDAAAAGTALEAARTSGRLPYARESLFYLGKAALQRGEVAAAREFFVAARDAGAGPGGEAARLVRAIDELENSR